MATYSVASVTDIVRTAIRHILTLMPCYLTGLLAITRFLQIKYPLRIINVKGIIGLLILAVLHICVVFVLFFRNGDQYNPVVMTMPMLQSVWNLEPSFFGHHVPNVALYSIIIFFVALLQLFAILASFLTVLELIKMYKKPMTDAARRNSVTGSLKIMITNFGSVANITLIAVKAYVSILSNEGDRDSSTFSGASWEKIMLSLFIEGPRRWFFAFLLVYAVFVPSVLSALNPAIYIAFTPGSRRWSRKISVTSTRTTVSAIAETQNM